MSASNSTILPPLPSPPFLNINNINNLRDAALFPLTTPNGPLRPRLLFRSADVSRLTAPDWKQLKSHGISHVFDLRSKPEVDKGLSGITGEENGITIPEKPDWILGMEQASIQRSWVPVFRESDYSPEGLAKRYVKYMDEDVKGFVEAYHDILLSGGPAYASIFRYLATLPNAAESENQPQGALIHCTAGKDRTGMFFAVLLSYLGVPKQVIAEEYNLTELGLAPVRESVVERLMLSPAFKNYIISRARGTPLSSSEIAKIIADEKEGKTTDSEDLVIPPEAMAKGRDAALRMVSAKKESMLQSLEMLEREFGGAEKYMRDVCGLSEGEMEALKRNLVDGKGEA